MLVIESPTRSWDGCLSKDEKNRTELIFTNNIGNYNWVVSAPFRT